MQDLSKREETATLLWLHKQSILLTTLILAVHELTTSKQHFTTKHKQKLCYSVFFTLLLLYISLLFCIFHIIATLLHYISLLLCIFHNLLDILHFIAFFTLLLLSNHYCLDFYLAMLLRYTVLLLCIAYCFCILTLLLLCAVRIQCLI